MTKEEIRKTYKAKRRKLQQNEIDKLEDLMLIQFQKLKLPSANFFMSYLPIEVQKEFNPWLIEEYYMLINENAQLVYPIINTSTVTMRAVAVFEENEYEENEYGLIQPIGGVKIDSKDIEVMIVPLIAFDKNGYRVGYGKGYYDKYLETCSDNLIKIGFSFFDPVVIDDLNKFDKKLDYCITPTKTYKFKK